MPTYAAGTKVSQAKSREEIASLLQKWGATGFAYMDHIEGAAVGFEMNSRTYRFILKFPKLEVYIRDYRKSESSGRVRRPDAQLKAGWEQMVREKWRAMVLMVKSKLIAVETGITSIEEEFLANAVTSNGQTVYEYIEPQLDMAFREGRMPRLLPTGK